jgi:7-carboxy-7-deazaguanine synthase
MKTHIGEVFSSIQGEGMLLGRRQVFIRFAGCNLNCNYCDTPQSRDPLYGNEISVDELLERVKKLITPDFHSVSLTGGEPLLHADFIRNFLEKYSFDALLETNGALPQELNKIVNLIKYASVDIKLPEHRAVHFRADPSVGDTLPVEKYLNTWHDLFRNEIKSINLLIEEGINSYCKMIVLPSTKLDTVGFIASRIVDEVNDTSKLSMVIQPVSPLHSWNGHSNKLFEISEKVGEYLDVLIIPQIHKLLKIK